MKLKELEKYVEKVWNKRLKYEVFSNHNFLLWEEKGIVALVFLHLKGFLEDYGKRTLIVPEYKPIPPDEAKKCETHKEVLKREYEINWRRKVDLCIVKFEENLDGIDFFDKSYKDCTL